MRKDGIKEDDVLDKVTGIREFQSEFEKSLSLECLADEFKRPTAYFRKTEKRW